MTCGGRVRLQVGARLFKNLYCHYGVFRVKSDMQDMQYMDLQKVPIADNVSCQHLLSLKGQFTQILDGCFSVVLAYLLKVFEINASDSFAANKGWRILVQYYVLLQ